MFVATGLVAYAVYSFLMARYRDARWRWDPVDGALDDDGGWQRPAPGT